MVMGLDDWPVDSDYREISEERLLASVQSSPGAAGAKAPDRRPVGRTRIRSNPFDDTAHVGVPVAPFPRWMVCPYCRLLAPLELAAVRAEARPLPPGPGRYVHANCTTAGQAAAPWSRPASWWPASTATSTTSPGSSSSTGAADRLHGTSCNSTKSGPSGEAAGHRGPVRRVRDVAARCPTPSSATTGRPARLPGAVAPPAGLRRGRLQGRAGPADPSRCSRGRRTSGSRSCSRRCRSRRLDKLAQLVDDELEPTWRDARASAEIASSGRRNLLQGLRRVHRRADSGRRSRSEARRAARTSDDAGRPEDARVGGLLRPRPRPRRAEDFQLRAVEPPRPLRQATSRRSSWSSGCGRSGP